MEDTTTTPTRSDIRRTLLFAGIGSALIAGILIRLATLAFLQYDLITNILCISAAIGTGLVTPLFWWCFVVQPRKLTILQGTYAGVLTSIVAYPLIWCIGTVLAFFFIGRPEFDIQFFGAVMSGGLYGNVISALVVAYWTFVYGLWLPVIAIGAVSGQLLVVIQKKVQEQWQWGLVP